MKYSKIVSMGIFPIFVFLFFFSDDIYTYYVSNMNNRYIKWILTIICIFFIIIHYGPYK
jgi:hypothetical protein